MAAKQASGKGDSLGHPAGEGPNRGVPLGAHSNGIEAGGDRLVDERVRIVERACQRRVLDLMQQAAARSIRGR